MDALSELERRCLTNGVLQDALSDFNADDRIAIVRAVLAEAGVAEMRQTIAEAYQAGADAVHKAWIDTGGNVPGYPDFWEAAHDYADSAKIGANQ